MGILSLKKSRALLALAGLPAVLLLAWALRNGWFQKEQLFLPENAELSHILISRDADSLLLLKGEEGWMLPGREQVAEVAVENLLYAASHMEVSSVLSALPSHAEQSIRELEFYRGDELELAWIFCRVGELYFLQVRGSEKWYRVGLPGYGDLDLETVFSNAASHYLNNALLQMDPSEISWVEVQRKGEKAFRIVMDDEGRFSCLFPATDSVLPAGQLDELSLRLLFSYFSDLRFEDLATSYPGPLPGKDPKYFMARLSLRSQGGEEHSLEVYALPPDNRGDAHVFKACVYPDNAPDALIVNYIYLDVLMRPLERYFAPGQ